MFVRRIRREDLTSLLRLLFPSAHLVIDEVWEPSKVTQVLINNMPPILETLRLLGSPKIIEVTRSEVRFYTDMGKLGVGVYGVKHPTPTVSLVCWSPREFTYPLSIGLHFLPLQDIRQIIETVKRVLKPPLDFDRSVEIVSRLLPLTEKGIAVDFSVPFLAGSSPGGRHIQCRDRVGELEVITLSTTPIERSSQPPDLYLGLGPGVLIQDVRTEYQTPVSDLALFTSGIAIARKRGVPQAITVAPRGLLRLYPEKAFYYTTTPRGYSLDVFLEDKSDLDKTLQLLDELRRAGIIDEKTIRHITEKVETC